jgi:outer membrane protein assembly factor BamE (lipoprotein component of BamABCDE complex)
MNTFLKRSVLRIAGILLTLIFLIGCATSGRKIDPGKLSQIKEGITTEAEVVNSLGAPWMKTLGSDGKTTMLYQYTKVKNRAANFIPVAGLLAGGMDMRQQMLTVLIGKDGKVEKYTMNDADTLVNSGLLNTN